MLHETFCKKGDVDMVSLLVENMSTEEINQPGFGGCTPLHIAVFHGFLQVVSVLASHGASLIVSKLELVSKELNHLTAFLHVYARSLNFMK